MSEAVAAPGTGATEGRNLRLQTVRLLTADLQESVDRIARAARDADGGVSPFGEHKLLRLVRGDDRCVAILLWREQQLVGAAHCDAYHTTAPDRPCRLTAEIVIHPDHRARGLGTLLLGGVLAQAREENADELNLWAYGDQAFTYRVAPRIGCVPGRTLLQLALPPERFSITVPPRDDVRLRSFDPGRDSAEWLGMHNRAFSLHPEQGAWDESDLVARMEQTWFRPSDMLLAEDRLTHQLAGFCWVKIPLDPAQPGEIYIVAVDPDRWGSGLGRFLTLAGLQHIRERGRESAMLYVEADNEAARKLYESLGFEERWRHVCWTRALTPKGEAMARAQSG